jgi:hypothetical protein
MLIYSLSCSCSYNLSSFWFKTKQQWTIEEISIFSNSSHLEWRAELLDTILKWDYPRTIPAKFGLIWFIGFREEDLNVIFYQNMSNLHNLYKSAWFIIKQQWTIEEISIFSNSCHLEWRAGLSDIILKGTHLRTIPARFGVIWFSGFRAKDLNVVFYQNMPNLHNRYKSAERKISQKNPEY